MNVLLLILELLFVAFSLIYLCKKYKSDGIYLWLLVFASILGIISQKTIEIFDLEVNLGVVINSFMFICSNILVQKKGPKEINKVLSIITLANAIIFTFSIISILCSSSSMNELENNAFNQLFNLNNRIYFSQVISIIISLWLNSMLYHQIRQVKNKIILSNVLSTIIIQFIECLLFCLIAYTFKVSMLNVIELIVIRYIFKVVIGILGTSVIYAVNSFER